MGYLNNFCQAHRRFKREFQQPGPHEAICGKGQCVSTPYFAITLLIPLAVAPLLAVVAIESALATCDVGMECSLLTRCWGMEQAAGLIHA